MITDGTFKFSDGQVLGAPQFSLLPARDYTAIYKGIMSDNHYDIGDIADTGGKAQYIHIHVDEDAHGGTTGTSPVVQRGMTIRAVAWTSTTAAPSLSGYNNDAGDTIDVASISLGPGQLKKGTDIYLPLISLNTTHAGYRPGEAAALFTPKWKWLNVVYLGSTVTGVSASFAGKVTTSLTDAISNEPRVYDAKNDT